MDNKSFRFRTNLNCGECVTAVKPHLDSALGICDWKVDTANKDKMLTVTTNGITEQQVVAIVQKAGFKIESVNV